MVRYSVKSASEDYVDVKSFWITYYQPQLKSLHQQKVSGNKCNSPLSGDITQRRNGPLYKLTVRPEIIIAS